MSNVINYFKELISIPRCSTNKKPFIKYISNFATTKGYSVEVDSVGNVLCKKSENATLCIQSHYDIVCVNNNNIELVVDKKYFTAKNSTLGADNGVGCAMMMSIMDDSSNIELLFTSDEEIGLIGANAFDMKLNATSMLNLDTEEEGSVYIGCAGGVDITANTTLNKIKSNHKYFYLLQIDDLDGGHSGVDIDKNIPNAFQKALEYLPSDSKIASINGGERINSIPKNVKIEFSSNEICDNKYTTTIKPLDIFTFDLKSLLEQFDYNVLEKCDTMPLPKSSQNLALISTINNQIKIEVSIRSMKMDRLEFYENQTKDFFKNYGFKVTSQDKYSTWTPTINQFSNQVKDVYSKYFKNVDFKAVHAGLECAVFKSNFPNMNITSIGPNIIYPHSLKEKVEIDSITRVEKVVKEIVKISN